MSRGAIDTPDSPVPTLKTERLQLSRPREDDVLKYAGIVTTERGRFIGGPFSEEDAVLDFMQMVAGWVLRGFGVWSIRERQSARFFGVVLVHHEWGDPEPELGWILTQEAEGQGIAFEAATAALNWAFENTPLTELVSYIDPDNERALRLASRLGGQRDKANLRVDNYDGEVVVVRYKPK